MKRREGYWVDFEPARGGEIRKVRTAIIMSNDRANYRLNRVQVVPLTSNVARVYPGEAIIRFAGKPSRAMANQLRTVTKERLQDRIGELSARDLALVEEAIRVQLGLR